MHNSILGVIKRMFATKIVMQDKTKEYMDVTWESLEKYPKDYKMQLKYVKENGTKQHYALWLANRLQYVSSLKSGREIKIDGANIDLICRSLMDALRHMQSNLPEGVYGYITSKMEDSMLDIVNKLND